MKRKSIVVLVATLLMLSISFAVYPSVSKTVVNYNNQTIADQYVQQLSDVYEGSSDDYMTDEEGYLINEEGQRISSLPIMCQEDLDRLYQDSVKYNDNLKSYQHVDDFEYAPFDLKDYGIQSGIYAIIDIPSINLNLPIYLGANEYNMSFGATHLFSTSLPIGGSGTNSVICGHTGYLGKVFFDDIGKLSEGDEIIINNYFGTLYYRVVYGSVIDSDNVDQCYLEHDKDLITLFTCADRGTKRYMVVAEREIDYE
ncbi:MAG: class C sortase [Ruminococcus sp.]|nr:class C sortase [Ruminococcus sp.]